MKRTKVIVVSVIGVLLLTAGIGGYIILEKMDKQYLEYQNSTITWMQKETKIQIPTSANLQTFDAGIEYGKLLKYKLQEDEVDEFIEKYGLSKINAETAETILIEDTEKNWKTERLKGEKEFYQLEDCKHGLVWKLLLERNDRLLWFEILHADWGGDLPECDKE